MRRLYIQTSKYATQRRVVDYLIFDNLTIIIINRYCLSLMFYVYIFFSIQFIVIISFVFGLFSFFFLFHILFFFFIVPPVIEPFNFPGDGLVEGTRTRVVCGVSHGDPPLSIAWLKDGVPVPQWDGSDGVATAAAAATADVVGGSGGGGGSDGAVVTALDPYSSLLSIPRLTRHHTGRYTCRAQNPAAQATYTAALLVKGKYRRGP